MGSDKAIGDGFWERVGAGDGVAPWGGATRSGGARTGKVIICFAKGTSIATPRGEVRIENLKVGDKVITRDNGPRPIRWIGHRDLTAADFAREPHLRPVLITAGSLGPGLPQRDMMVSPSHRMLAASDRTALFFSEREVLIPAKHLIGNHGVHQIDSAGTTYMHLLCDQHEVLLANGVWSESFQPGDRSLRGIGNSQRSEVYEIFPELKDVVNGQSFAAARRSVRSGEISEFLS